MNKLSAQTIIAIIVVAIFMIVTGIIAVYSYANDIAVDKSITAANLKDYSSIFTGLIGTIIGYYFGKDKSN